MKEMAITPDQKKLWGKSGARCATCQSALIEQKDPKNDSGLLLGEMAHIAGEKSGSARYDPNMTDAERNAETNLLLLCPNDHTKIDKDPNEYTVEKLHQIKSGHEKWVQDAILAQMPNVTFAELEVTINYLIKNTSSDDEAATNFIKPKEKIAKNSLSTEIENLIKMGMSRAKEVKDYLNTNPDLYFAERLKNGLVEKYNEYKNQELDADTIFLELLSFASGNSNDDKNRAAALAVIVYFFEACDIFEK